jgi:hypothetical protein
MTDEKYSTLFSEEVLRQYRNKWIHTAILAGPDIDKDAVHEGVKFVYEISDYAPPKDIYILDSPAAMQKKARELLGVDTYVSISYTLSYSAGWVGFYDVFLCETDLLSGQPKEYFIKYKAFMESGAFMAIYMDEAALVCRRPQFIRRDEENRLHHDTLPALEFIDGSKYYFLDGTAFDAELFKKVSDKTITLEEINAIENGDQRAIAYKYGLPVDTMLKDMKAVLVNTGTRGTRLWKIDNFYNTNTTAWAMDMDCPTGRRFLEFVEPDVAERAMREHPDNAAEYCQAWAYKGPGGESITLDEYTAVQHHG